MLSHVTQGDNDVMAIFSKGNRDKNLQCSVCGRKGHLSDKCWGVTGYPKWHLKHKPGQKMNASKWSPNRGSNPITSNNVQGNIDDQQNITMTSKQLEQLLKLIPKEISNQKGSETDEEIDYGFSGMVCSSEKSTGACRIDYRFGGV